MKHCPWTGGCRIRIEAEAKHLTLKFSYRIGDGPLEQVYQIIELDHTECHFGGSRVWFHCPRCNKRVTLIYGARKLFLCRHCYNLAYVCHNERKFDRLLRKKRKIRHWLGVEGLQEPILFKPKHMHQGTFERLRHEAASVYEEAGWLTLSIVGLRE